MTFAFDFISGMLRQFLALDGQGLNQSNIQSTFQEQPLLIAVFACIIGPLVEELFFRQLLLHYLQKKLSTWLSILLVGLVFALTHMHNVSLSEWIGAVVYLGKYLLSLGRPYDNEQPLLYQFSPVLNKHKKATARCGCIFYSSCILIEQ